MDAANIDASLREHKAKQCQRRYYGSNENEYRTFLHLTRHYFSFQTFRYS